MANGSSFDFAALHVALVNTSACNGAHRLFPPLLHRFQSRLQPLYKIRLAMLFVVQVAVVNTSTPNKPDEMFLITFTATNSLKQAAENMYRAVVVQARWV